MQLDKLFSAVRLPSQRPSWQRYGFAVAVILFAWAAREALSAAVGTTALPFVFFFPAVTVAAWYSGFGPAAVSIILSSVLASSFFVDAAQDVVSVFAFVGGCTLMILAMETMHRTRARLVNAQQLMETTVASIGDGVIVTDETGRVTFLNAEAERLTGWKKTEAAGLPLVAVFQIRNEQTRQVVENPVEKVLQFGNIVGLANHTILISKDGREIPIDDSAAPIRAGDSPIFGAVLVFRDVTAQRRADHARARLAAIVEFSGDAIITKDLNGVIRTWNASAERILGYTADEIVGKPVTLLIPHDRLDEETEILQRLRRGLPYERLETIRLRKGGIPVHVSISVSPVKDNEGNVTGASKILHDITDIVATREALAKEKELLDTTLRSIGDAVVVTDAHGNVTFLNAEAERLTGWTHTDAAGLPLPEIFHIVNEETRQTVENPVDKVLRTGSIVGLANHTMLIAKDGTERPIDDSAAPIRPAGGTLLGVVLVFRDFTERRQSEIALREEARRKDEFLAILSHELRNPLAPIGFAVEILQRMGPPDPEFRNLRDVIERQTKQLTRLLDDLLDISRISSGKISLTKERLDLKTAIASAVESVRPQIDSRKHELTLKMPPDPVYVDGDTVRLAQVVANLLNNAARYTDNGGLISLTLAKEGSDAVIRVRDTGIGIREEQLSEIFDMFTQVDRSLERGQGGLGVGLSLTRQLIGLHGGTIEAKSEGIGKGSEFIVRIPAATGTQPQAQPSPASPAAREIHRRILVADDNKDSAQVLGSLLRASGHDVRTAFDGIAALDAVRSFRPEIAILDIGMPRLNGYDTAQQIRTEFGTSIVLVAVTGWGQEQDRLRAKEAGFDYHLTKPIDIPSLEKILDRPR